MLIVPNGLPAEGLLRKEGVAIIGYEQAIHQDIRPLQVLVFNLMPDKVTTETQLLRVLSPTPLQLTVRFLHTKTYESQNTAKDHLEAFYVDFDQVKDDFFDVMIITGAPNDAREFTEVDYWQELCYVMEWSRRHVFSTLHICWGALAGLQYHYQVEKIMLPEKLSGVFHHHKTRLGCEHTLTQGFDDDFLVPHSRVSGICQEGLQRAGSMLQVLVTSKKAGLHLVVHENMRQLFVTGHPEYDRMTLAHEYHRDRTKGLKPSLPVNYYPNNDVGRVPRANWQSHAQLLYSNWINYVYQVTPAAREDIALVPW